MHQTGRIGNDLRARDIRGQLLVVFGEADPHVPEEGRWKVAEALADDCRGDLQLAPERPYSGSIGKLDRNPCFSVVFLTA